MHNQTRATELPEVFLRISSIPPARLVLPLLMAGSLAVAGCTSSPSAPAPTPSALVTPSAAAPLLLPGGIRATDLKPGSGPPNFETATHARVSLVQRVGDKTIATRDHYEFKIAGNREYPGLVEGMRGMQLGGTRRIEVPPALAFGKKGKAPEVPPDSTIVYEVHIEAMQLPPMHQPPGAQGMPLPTGIPITVSPRASGQPASPLPAPR